MKYKVVSISDARKSISEIANEVLYLKIGYVITRKGKPICVIHPLNMIGEEDSKNKGN